ncbi:hypothetical protein YPPY42_1892, partial [Yersinia pestis PY-42]
MELACLAESSF